MSILQEGPIFNTILKINYKLSAPFIKAVKNKYKMEAPESKEFEECIFAFKKIKGFTASYKKDKDNMVIPDDTFRSRFNITNREVVSKLMDEAYSHQFLLSIGAGLHKDIPFIDPSQFNFYGVRLAFTSDTFIKHKEDKAFKDIYEGFAFATLRPINHKEHKRIVPFIFKVKGDIITNTYCLLLKFDKKYMYRMVPYELKCMKSINPKLYQRNKKSR